MATPVPITMVVLAPPTLMPSLSVVVPVSDPLLNRLWDSQRTRVYPSPTSWSNSWVNFIVFSILAFFYWKCFIFLSVTLLAIFGRKELLIIIFRLLFRSFLYDLGWLTLVSTLERTGAYWELNCTFGPRCLSIPSIYWPTARIAPAPALFISLLPCMNDVLDH